MTALEEDNRESAERIKTLMFTFDDLVKLDTGFGFAFGESRHQGFDVGAFG